MKTRLKMIHNVKFDSGLASEIFGIDLIPENEEERELTERFRTGGVCVKSYSSNGSLTLTLKDLISNDNVKGIKVQMPKPITILKKEFPKKEDDDLFIKIETILLRAQKFSALRKNLEDSGEYDNLSEKILAKFEEKFMNEFVNNLL